MARNTLGHLRANRDHRKIWHFYTFFVSLFTWVSKTNCETETKHSFMICKAGWIHHEPSWCASRLEHVLENREKHGASERLNCMAHRPKEILPGFSVADFSGRQRTKTDESAQQRWNKNEQNMVTGTGSKMTSWQLWPFSTRRMWLIMLHLKLLGDAHTGSHVSGRYDEKSITNHAKPQRRMPACHVGTWMPQVTC